LIHGCKYGGLRGGIKELTTVITEENTGDSRTFRSVAAKRINVPTSPILIIACGAAVTTKRTVISSVVTVVHTFKGKHDA